MRRNVVSATALAVALCGSAMVAGAASDYYLKIEGVEGEATASDAGIKLDVSSFSWGASQAGSMTSSAAGRESPTRAGTKAGRDVASGMASGKRSAAAAPVTGDAAARVAASEPVEAADNTLTVTVPETAATRAALDRMCATGRHIKKAVLGSAGKTYELHNVVVVGCTAQGAQREVRYKTGHVTLIK